MERIHRPRGDRVRAPRHGPPRSRLEEPRRPGDPAVLIASSEKIGKELGWKPEFTNLDEISRARGSGINSDTPEPPEGCSSRNGAKRNCLEGQPSIFRWTRFPADTNRIALILHMPCGGNTKSQARRVDVHEDDRAAAARNFHSASARRLGDRRLASSGPTAARPMEVRRGIADLVRHGPFIKYVVASLFRVTWGFSSPFNSPFRSASLSAGIAARRWHSIRSCRSSVPFRRWPGSPSRFSGLASAISPLSFSSSSAASLPLLLTAINAVQSVPAVYMNAGRNFGLRPTELIRRVLYPAVVPRLITGLRITLGVAWLVVVAAEMIAVTPGLVFSSSTRAMPATATTSWSRAWLSSASSACCSILAMRSLEAAKSASLGIRRRNRLAKVLTIETTTLASNAKLRADQST